MRKYVLFLTLLIPVFGFAQSGPAGVGTSTTNRLWLKADANVYKDVGVTLAADGDLVRQWNDKSGNANNAFQATSGNQPTYKANIINGKPALLFSGDSFVDAATLSIANNTGFTYIVVFNPTSVNTGALSDGAGDYVIDRTTGTQDLAALKFTLNSGTARYAFQKRDAGGGGLGGPETSAVITTSTFHLVDYSREIGGGAQYRLYLDGALNGLLADGDGNLTPPDPRIGRHATTTGGGLKGYMTELLIYNYRLNDSQIKIVNSYLAAKYNFAISNDKYTYDATHGNDVAGIGSEGAGNTNVDAISASVLEISGPTAMATGDYLLFGHDNASIAAWTTTEAPNSGTNIQRISREWRLNETGDANGVGNMKFSVNTSSLPALTGGGYSKYGLMIDSDGDFSSGALVYEMSLFSGSTWETAANININNGDYVSIAEIRPTIGFASNAASGFESVTAVSLTATLNYIAKTAVTATVNTTAGTATAGTDYTTITGGTVTIAVGSSTGNISVTVNNDIIVESSETFTVTLSSPSGGVNLGPFAALIYTINDDDNSRKVFFSPSSASGNESVTAVTITVSDSPNQDNTNPTSVAYTVTGGTATGGGVDYTLANGTATIAAGTTTKTIPLTIVNDALFESNETIIITLSSPTNSNLSASNTVYTYTIVDDDIAPTIQFSSTSGSGLESVASPSFPVALSAASGTNTTVNYTVTGTATGGGVDYTLANGTLTIIAGATTGNIVPVIIDDATTEFSETIVVTLSSPSGASLGVNTVYTYTILDNDVFGYKGPGGVGDQITNKLWVSADNGVYSNTGTILAVNGGTVQQWNDRSGNSNNVSQATGSLQPTLNTSGLGGKPALTFSSGYMDAGALGIAGSGGFSFFLALQPTSVGGTGTTGDGSGDYIIDRTASNNQLASLKVVSGNAFGFQKRDNSSNGIGGPNTTGFSTGTSYLIDYMRVRGSSFGIYLNGTATTVADGIGDLTLDPPRIGSHQSGGQNFRGLIGELAIYNTGLNTAQRIIVENYLASKYGLTLLAASDKFSYDGGGQYGNDVAGIGMEDASNFHTDAQGSGVVRVNNATSMDPADYFLWGHDGNTGTDQVDVPAGIQTRLKKIWKVDERGDLGFTDFSFDLTALGSVTASDLRLLIDKTANGFADETVVAGTVISGATSVGGNVYKFSGINMSNGWRFTLGSINKTVTPLPIELLSFGAAAEGRHVNINWSTASEVNNNYFTVERSTDGVTFEAITTVNGAGFSTARLSYGVRDDSPYSGLSYYRLKQTDYDLRSTYSRIVSVHVDLPSGAIIFPNPARNQFTIQLNGDGVADIAVFNIFGQRMITLPSSNTGKISVDITGWAKGIYVVKISHGTTTESQRVMVE